MIGGILENYFIMLLGRLIFGFGGESIENVYFIFIS